MVMDTAPRGQARGHRAPRRHHRQGHVRRVLAHGRTARIRSDDAATSSIRSTTIGSSRATRPAGLEIMEDLPDVDAIVASIGGGGLLAGVAAAVRALNPNDARLRRGTRDRGAAQRVAGRGTAGVLRATGGRRSSTAPAASRCWRRCGRSCGGLDGSIVVSLDEVADAIKADRRARARHRRRRRRMRRRRRAQRRAPAAARSWPSSPAATSIWPGSPRSSEHHE